MTPTPPHDDTHPTLFDTPRPKNTGGDTGPFGAYGPLYDEVGNLPIHPSWAATFTTVAPTITALNEQLQQLARTGEGFLPHHTNILNAYRTPLDAVRVLILGQDPYPTPGHATGYAFATSRDTHPLPRSLNNIYTELHADQGCPIPTHGDLTAWTSQGVMLLNTTLTVAPGAAGSHSALGWKPLITTTLETLNTTRGNNLVAILWGKHAQSFAQLLPDAHIIASAHPSPLSARRGFFGSRPFSATNDYFVHRGQQPIAWNIDPEG